MLVKVGSDFETNGWRRCLPLTLVLLVIGAPSYVQAASTAIPTSSSSSSGGSSTISSIGTTAVFPEITDGHNVGYKEDDNSKMLHEELSTLLTELRQVADAIEAVRKEHTRLAKGVGEISSVVKDMNARSEHIRKKVKKMSKTINKNTHHHKLKDTLKALQKDHEHILRAVTSISNHHHNSGRSGRNNTKTESRRKTNKSTTTESAFTETTLSTTLTTPLSMNTTPEESESDKDNSTVSELVAEPPSVVPLPQDCTEVMQRGNWTSGAYHIQPKGYPAPIKVWCDHTTDGGGWTIIVARHPQDPQQDFDLKWEDYKKGFGDPAKEHWIGTAPMHFMTKDRRHELRVNITDWLDTPVHAKWKDFRVDDEDNFFALGVGRYASDSTAGDALKWHDGMRFSTPDRDNDALMGGHCAEKNDGGWWYRGYRGCYHAHPTGRYQKNPPKIASTPTNSSRRNFDLGPVLVWQNWRGESFFPKTLFLMFRPVI